MKFEDLIGKVVDVYGMEFRVMIEYEQKHRFVVNCTYAMLKVGNDVIPVFGCFRIRNVVLKGIADGAVVLSSRDIDCVETDLVVCEEVEECVEGEDIR